MTPYPTRPATAHFLTLTGTLAVPPGFRVGRRVAIELPKPDPETGAPLPLRPCPFTHLLFADDAVDAAAPPGTATLAGTQHIVLPGDGAVLVVMLARRREGLTHQAFRDRWLHGHAPFGLRIAASGYRQLHPHAPPGTEGYDGAGLVFFRDLDHVASARAAPEVAREATRDEMAFIDHGRSQLAMFRFA